MENTPEMKEKEKLGNNSNVGRINCMCHQNYRIYLEGNPFVRVEYKDDMQLLVSLVLNC